MNAWLSFAPLWLIDMAVLASTLLAAALTLRLILRDAKSRVLLAWSTWLGIVVAALITLLPGWPRYNWSAIARSLNNQPAAAASAPDLAQASTRDVNWQPPLPVARLGDEASAISVPPNWMWRELALFAWLAGVVVGLAWIALGCWQARKLLRQSQPAPRWIGDELAPVTASRGCLPETRLSLRLTSAVALRARRPVIMLPKASAVPTNIPAIRAALAHEWAHIRHGDLWLLALERLLLPLLALHPLFWWLRRSTRLDQELLADAAAAGDKPVEYAEALVAWAKTSSPPPASLAALAFWDRPSNLTRRVHMILNRPASTTSWFSRVVSFAALACLLVLVGGLSVITLRPLAAEDVPKPSKPASVVEHPIELGLTLPPATPAFETIELACVAMELAPSELAKVLASGEHPPEPSPGVELGIQTSEAWRATLNRLEANPDVKIVSQPYVRTLNNRRASIAMAAGTVKYEGQEETLGVRIDLQPELLTKIDQEQQILLSIAFERSLLDDNAKPPRLMKRQLQTKVAFPLGKVVVVADPSNRSARAKRPLLLAIEPRLVMPFAETREATLDIITAGAQREAAAVRHTLLRMQREIASLIDQTTDGTTFHPKALTIGQGATSETAAVPQATSGTTKAIADQRFHHRLLELDLREAEIKLQSAQAAHDLVVDIEKKNPGAISESELRQSRLKVDLAQVQVERTKVRLDAHRAANPPATPAASRR